MTTTTIPETTADPWQRVTIVLVALPSDVPPVRRIRAALKLLLRAFGLRAETIECMTEEETE